MKTKLKPYIASGGLPEEGALLVFAHTSKEAKKISYQAIMRFDMYCEYTDVRIKLLNGREFLYKYADQELLYKNKPHYTSDIPACKQCGYWGRI